MSAKGSQPTLSTAPGDSARSRVKAKEEVLQNWQARRERITIPPDASQHATNTFTTNDAPSFNRPKQSRPGRISSKEPSKSSLEPVNIFPSICFLFQTALKQFRPSKSDEMKLSDHFNENARDEKETLTNSENQVYRLSFPSVLPIQQASELVRQVESLRAAQEDHFDLVGNESSGPQQLQQDVLSVLPSGYDLNKAVWQMAERRSRAFWLMDLTAIVRTSVQWKSQFPKGVQVLYQVQYNADKILLQVLQRLGIGLVVTDKSQIDQCLTSFVEVDERRTAGGGGEWLFDSASVSGKPTGFLRKWLSQRTTPGAIAVDGPQEVQRIYQSTARFQKRRRTIDNSITNKMAFLLRLQEDTSTWESTLSKVLNVLENNSCISGVSLDLGSLAAAGWIELVSMQFAVEKLFEFLYKRTGHPLRLDLTGIDHDHFPAELVLWWGRLLSDAIFGVVKITVDATHILVAPAGALCTRIIGLKTSFAGDASSRRHYYIDDGCYGSLYDSGKRTKADLHPLPLPKNRSCSNDTEDMLSTKISSTIWGPTCDGLDRVCGEIALPPLQRDDWLIFPKLGYEGGEGMGTAFNGFDPPDTAYCVLDYFR